jgi:hypothetical protein
MERGVAILQRGGWEERRMRGEGGGLETLSLSLILAPLSRRRETVESFPLLQARWRGVEPYYREEDERRGGWEERRRNWRLYSCYWFLLPSPGEERQWNHFHYCKQDGEGCRHPTERRMRGEEDERRGGWEERRMRGEEGGEDGIQDF